MSIENLVREMPKVELHVHLEGAMHKDTLLMIAEQNEVADSLKNFERWVELLDAPDYDTLDDLLYTVSAWLEHPEDLTRIVYDLGVDLAKQNVRYAEVSVNPGLYMQNGMSFAQFLKAINDGRDRVERGWQVRIAWILTVYRREPRRADEVARWSFSAASEKSGVAGMGLAGREDVQPIGQFDRAFNMAEKKDFPRVPHAGDVLGGEGIEAVLRELHPDCVMDGWGVADSPELLALLAERGIPLRLSMIRALRAGQIDKYADYPLRRLYDENVRVSIGCDMPALFKTTLTDEYLAAVTQCGLSHEELEEIALNAVRDSLLPEEEKQSLLAEFSARYAELRAGHLAAGANES